MTTATYRRLGSTGLEVSALALGTMQFGWTADEETSFAILDAFAEWGGTLVDTADVYSRWANAGGVSEEIIGRWMKARRNRDDIVLATKVRGGMGTDGQLSRHLRHGLSRRWITRACEDSLRRLGVDHIDLYQAHWLDPSTPIEETLSALTDLVRRGLVRYIGCSNFSAWRLMQSLWASDKHGLERFVALQPEYSIAEPTRGEFEREIGQVCAAYGIGVIPYSPLAGGFLTGKYRRDAPLPDSARAEGNRSRMTDQNWAVLDELTAVADAHGGTPAQVALAWLLSRPAVTAPIVGANSVQQLTSLLPATALELTRDELSRLDEASAFTRSRPEREE